LALRSPSPQIGRHGDPGVGQVKPVSIMHMLEHPSPVALLPSSQVSVPFIIIESPQIAEHAAPTTRHR